MAIHFFFWEIIQQTCSSLKYFHGEKEEEFQLLPFRNEGLGKSYWLYWCPPPSRMYKTYVFFLFLKKRVKKIIINQNKVEGSRFQMNENMIESVRLSSSYTTYH